ncbi:hypothetical protein ABL78_4765 [Leptomonas seymouri]|uniref:Uncharacterized protein n=1 Tax=Leptomonas seymouri TaxID=5684 RepID=A0A0N0P587_LEPSE|nr:hypothetical protein ABL78_4765 [Leptomonas seymouri]|eukprot:KPI86176.1 hypothetical protein ABL78_4765 [Leptomonas seymouri]
MKCTSASHVAAKGLVASQKAKPKKNNVGAGTSRGAAATTVVSRSSRAEALVQYVTHQPSFLTWAETSTSAALAPLTSPRGVAQYLEARVADVVAQLSSLQHAGDYNRLVLLAELLHGDMVAGVTPGMIEGGLLDLLRAASTAVAQGEVARQPAVAESLLAMAQNEKYLFHTINGTTGTSDTNFFQATDPQQQSTHGFAAAAALAAPIESLLPPLIDQTLRKTKGALESAAATTTADVTNGEKSAEEEEMEAWENYMAVVRVATTTDAVLPHDSVTARLPSSIVLAETDGALTAKTSAAMAAVAACASSELPRIIDSLPAAVCALIASCTSSPFVCLTLQDQQCEKAAVANLARALLDMTKVMGTAAGERSEVRLAAIKGLFRLLSTYVAKSSEGKTASSLAQTRAWRPTGSLKASHEKAATATAFSPPGMLEGTQISEMLDDITLEWAQILVLLKEMKPPKHTPSDQAGDSASDEEEACASGSVAVTGEPSSHRAFASTSTSRSSGPAGELYWVLEIANQLLQAQQRNAQHSGSISSCTSPPKNRLLPHTLIPVTLRTLSMVPTTPSLALRAAMYARLCVDVLWKASLLAPVLASRQLLYGSPPKRTSRSSDDPSALSASAHEEADSPVVDFFLVLLYQFNETHSLAHREMRDDLITLLALLLRNDAQFCEDELTVHRAAADVHAKPSGSYDNGEDSPNATALEACTPLSLTIATVEAVNAIVALLFEATCGAELSAGGATMATSRSDGRTLPDSRDAQPSPLLSEDAVRNYTLRFQSISISASRRREAVEFKKYGWQLLEAHFGWQLAHLTFRAYMELYHPDASSSFSSSVAAAGRAGSQPQQQYHQRTAPIPQVTGESVHGDAVTDALLDMQPCRLGYFDVLLLYVDLNSTVPAVVTWTREELMILEEEAWQLFTSMILFTQRLDAAAGGIRVSRSHRCGPPSPSLRKPAERSEGDDKRPSTVRVSSVPLGSVSDHSDDEESIGVLYGADMHFIMAGGVEVALRFLSAAPPEMEAVKRSALVTLAAIARTCSSVEAHLHSDSYISKEVALVHRVLTEHAPALVPFLVKMIREVDTYVDATGTPAVAPPLISSAAFASAMFPNEVGYDDEINNGHVPTVIEKQTTSPVHTTARWGWLPLSASLTVVFAWSLLRYIGDVLLEEEGMLREVSEIAMDGTGAAGDDADEDDSNNGVNDAAHHANSVDNCAHSKENSPCCSKHRSNVHPSGRLSNVDGGNVKAAAGQYHDTAIEIAMMDCSTSSSGSSMGPPPGEEWVGEGEAVQRECKSGAAATNLTLNSANDTQQKDGLFASTASRPSTLLRSMREGVLLIPSLFANEGGIELLTQWIRHTLSLCLSDRRQNLPSVSQTSPRQRAPVLCLEVDEVAELDRTSDLFLLLLDVFRAIVLGSEGNEKEFVRSGGVHGLLDLIEAFALAHGLMERAASHARLVAADATVAAYAEMETQTTAEAKLGQKDRQRVMFYAMTLLSDLLDNCPRALDEFSTWHSGRIFTSPLTPDVQECWAASKGISAVQLLLCLWVADLPARGDRCSMAAPSTNSGLELLRLHLRPALRRALKEAYVCRLLRRRAKIGALEADEIRCYYHYIYAEDGAVEGCEGAETKDDMTNAVVMAYMERLMRRHSKPNAIPSTQQIALLVNDTLGLCLKVYGCLAVVGFDSLCAAEMETAASPSLHMNLSSLERSFLVQIAALPALCVDEVSTAMAEVALENEMETSVSASAWRPTTPDRTTLSSAAAEALVRARELDQIIEVGAQAQQARGTQLYHRYLVTQLRQPVAPPADGRPGAVKGAWKTQRRLSSTIGGAPVTPAVIATGTTGEHLGVHAAELAARLSTRLATEERQYQQSVASTILQRSIVRVQSAVEEDDDGARLRSAYPMTLGSSRTPYASLMNSVQAAASNRQPATPFHVTPPPRRSALPLTERFQKRQAMIARSVRKFPLDASTPKGNQTL